MNWPYLKRIAGIVLLIIVIGGLLFVSAMYQGQLGNTNYGFGPEWDCSKSVPKGIFCIKRPLKSDKSN